ncbi:MAG: zinc-binding dehydrogenase [Ilumatobacteraceae bacterium]
MSTTATIAVSGDHANSPVELIEVQLPDPLGHEVLVKVNVTALCHSQLHNLASERHHRQVLGHEATGTVEKVGPEVTSVAVGETVLVTWVPKDAEQADRSAAAATVTLPDGSVAISPNVYTWGTHLVVDEMYVLQLPDDIDLDAAALLGCAVITGAGAVVNTAQVTEGESVVVIGVGGVGLCAVAAAARVGASPIIAVDLTDEKLNLARQFGATHTINASTTDDPVADVMAMTPGNGLDFPRRSVTGADFVFDCIGKPATVAQALAMTRAGRFGVRRGGMALVVGVPTSTLELPPGPLLTGERTLIGSLGGSCSPSVDVPKFVEWWKDGSLAISRLVTARYPLERINDAVADLKSGQIEGRALLDVPRA